MLKVFIGYDEREREAYDVCEYSMRRLSSMPLDIQTIGFNSDGFVRPWRLEGKQYFDGIDGRPFSTQFAFARFLVPHLMGYKGWALFCDCDFLWRGDAAELYEQRNEDKAVQLVMHRYLHREGKKMDGVQQAPYERKNWSSMVLWNCGHRAHQIVSDYRGINPHKVNTYPGFFLHTFQWLAMHEIGEVGEEWNWLVGYSPDRVNPKAVHYTEGGPWFEQYRNVKYADEWLAERERMMREAA